MGKRKKDDEIPILRIKKGDSLKTIYAKYRKAFTAADLAKYAVDEEGIPAEEVIASMETVQRKAAASKPLVRRTNSTCRAKPRSIQRNSIRPSRRRTDSSRIQQKRPLISRSAAMAKPKKDNGEMPILRVKKGASLKTIYAKAQRAFTAADLASFATDEPGIPAEEALARLEAVQREASPPKSRTKRKKA